MSSNSRVKVCSLKGLESACMTIVEKADGYERVTTTITETDTETETETLIAKVSRLVSVIQRRPDCIAVDGLAQDVSEYIETMNTKTETDQFASTTF